MWYFPAKFIAAQVRSFRSKKVALVHSASIVYGQGSSHTAPEISEVIKINCSI
jgi:hypothetical protein